MSDIIAGIKRDLEEARVAWEMKVEQACLETIETAKQVSQSLGEVSVDELNKFILEHFIERMNAPSYFGSFQGKITK